MALSLLLPSSGNLVKIGSPRREHLSDQAYVVCLPMTRVLGKGRAQERVKSVPFSFSTDEIGGWDYLFTKIKHSEREVVP